MQDSIELTTSAPDDRHLPPEVEVRRRRGPSLVWLIPVVAALLGGYLAWVTLEERGPEIVLTFQEASGLEAGRTKVKYKDVGVGEVEAVVISPDRNHIRVTVRMVKEAADYLTEGARFWVVRPRIGSGGVSGLETVVSGSYIGVDPGPRDGKPTRDFTGLEEPPLIRSDVPGTRFILRSDRLGSIGRGSSIYYRGVDVGQVLGSELTSDHSEIVFPVFVRAPYDGLVHTGSQFWNASGIGVNVSSQGLHIEMASLQTILAGGIEFDTPSGASTEKAKPEATFPLFNSREDVAESAFTERVPALVYFTGSVRGLKPGAPVEVKGLPVGRVTNVRLVYDSERGEVRIPVSIEIEPQRIVVQGKGALVPTENHAVLRSLVERGLRAQLQTGSLITGELVVALDFFPNATPADVTMEGDTPVLPSIPTQLDTLTASVTGVLDRVAALPLEELVGDARNAVASITKLVSSPELQRGADSLDKTISDIQKVTSELASEIGPSAGVLRETLTQANLMLHEARDTVQGVNGLVGDNSQLRRNTSDLMRELQVAARSIRVFADYLERHPESLIRGKAGSGP